MATIVALIVTGVAALASPPPAVPVKPEAVTSSPSATPPVQGSTSLRALPGAPTLACIRRWESLTSGLYRAISPGGRYRGAYQFDFKTWAGVGGSGDPAEASPDEQDYRASLLLELRGLAPWPTPARRCA